MKFKSMGMLVFADCSYLYSGPTTTGLVVFLVVESLLFGLFTAFMFCDQMCSIAKSESTIDRMKRRRDQHPGGDIPLSDDVGPPPRASLTHNLRNVCGVRASISWLSPFTRVRVAAADDEMVYCEPDAAADVDLEAHVNTV